MTSWAAIVRGDPLWQFLQGTLWKSVVVSWASTQKVISSFKALRADVPVPPITNFKDESKGLNDPFVNLGFGCLLYYRRLRQCSVPPLPLIAVLKR